MVFIKIQGWPCIYYTLCWCSYLSQLCYYIAKFLNKSWKIRCMWKNTFSQISSQLYKRILKVLCHHFMICMSFYTWAYWDTLLYTLFFALDYTVYEWVHAVVLWKRYLEVSFSKEVLLYNISKINHPSNTIMVPW